MDGCCCLPHRYNLHIAQTICISFPAFPYLINFCPPRVMFISVDLVMYRVALLQANSKDISKQYTRLPSAVNLLASDFYAINLLSVS